MHSGLSCRSEGKFGASAASTTPAPWRRVGFVHVASLAVTWPRRSCEGEPLFLGHLLRRSHRWPCRLDRLLRHDRSNRHRVAPTLLKDSRLTLGAPPTVVRRGSSSPIARLLLGRLLSRRRPCWYSW